MFDIPDTSAYLSKVRVARTTLRKINEDKELLWTGFQLKNQTHFRNARNQFIQGRFILVAHSDFTTLNLTKNCIVAQKASFTVSMIEFPGAVIRIESQRTL